MATIRESYKKANDAWPLIDPTRNHGLPPMTDWEAVRAASRLYRFARGAPCPLEIRATSGRRRTWPKNGILWVNPNQGWHDFVHDLSHWLFPKVYDAPDRHSKLHARFERSLIRQVVRRGWLDGRLKREEKPKPPAAPEPSKAARLLKERERIERRLERAERKLKRAQALAIKLERLRNRLDRRIERAAAANQSEKNLAIG